MEEKILIKGVFGGKIIPVILYILAALSFVILTIIDFSLNWGGPLIMIGVLSAVILFGVGAMVNAILKKREMIVTNKRVIARGAFGYRTDLPIEKVTDISMRWFDGLGCGTPSLKIMFHFCKNKTEVFDAIISESLQRDSKYQ